MNPVVHFELPFENQERATAFYQQAFGWKPVVMGGDMGNYVVVQTTPTDEQGMISTPGHINGGLYEKKPDWPAQYPSIVIAIEDMEKAMGDIRAAGGTVLGEPVDIPGIGTYVSFTDTEGNRGSILKPLARG